MTPNESLPNDPTRYGSKAWWDSNPPLEQRIAYAIEIAPLGEPDDGLLGWRPETEAVLQAISDAGYDLVKRPIGPDTATPEC